MKVTITNCDTGASAVVAIAVGGVVVIPAHIYSASGVSNFVLSWNAPGGRADAKELRRALGLEPPQICAKDLYCALTTNPPKDRRQAQWKRERQPWGKR